MKKAISFVCVLLTAFGLCVGCQKSPDSPIVVQKNTTRMIEKAKDSTGDTGETLEQRLNIPSRYHIADAYYDGKLQVFVDAEIELPDSPGLPTTRVTSGSFDQDRVNALYQVLVGGVQMYERSDQRTKSQLEKEILSQEAFIRRIEAGEKFEGETVDVDYERQRLNELEEEYRAAPEAIESVSADATLQTDENGSHVDLSGTAADGNEIVFSVSNNSDTGISDFSFNRGANAFASGEMVVSDPYPIEKESIQDALGGISELTHEQLTQSEKQAIELFKNIGECDIAVTGMNIIYIFPMSAVDEAYNMLGAQEKQKKCKELATDAYVELVFSRVIDGIPITSEHHTFQTGVSEGETIPAYMKEWPYELISVSVDKAGIRDISWASPLDVIENITDNTAMLGFNDIDSVFRQMFKVKYSEMLGASIDAGDIISGKYNINRVVLALRRIREKNSTDTGLIIPVWDFYGTYTMEYNGEPSHTWESEDSLLTINAIDGSIIDLSSGY